MPTYFRSERRQLGKQVTSNGKPGILRLPPSRALAGLGSAALLTAIVDNALAHQVWFGPIYLLISALSAWLVSSRIAIAVSTIFVAFNLIIGNEIAVHGTQSFLAVNAALRIFCLLSLVLLLGSARKSLEKEWRLARIEPLTGALNRQAFFERIKDGAGHRGPALLIFADVDGLKRLNDEKGHGAGDAFLRAFADRVRTAIRADDLFARVGGDEFVIFMKVRDEKASLVIANRLNHTLNLGGTSEGSNLNCSLGVLFLPSGSASIDSELRLADRLMYAAKRAKTGVCLAKPADVERLSVSTLTQTEQRVPTDTATRSTSRPTRDLKSGGKPATKSLAA